MDKAGVQVLKKVHVRGAEAGVIVEVISGRDGEGDLRQLHHSGLTHSHQRGGPQQRLGSQTESGGPRRRLVVQKTDRLQAPKQQLEMEKEEEEEEEDYRASSGECQTGLVPPG